MSRSNTLTLYDLVSTEQKTLKTTVSSDVIRIVSEHLPIQLRSQKIDLYDVVTQTAIEDVVGTLTTLVETVRREPEQRKSDINTASQDATRQLEVLESRLNDKLTILQNTVIEEVARSTQTNTTEIVKRVALEAACLDAKTTLDATHTTYVTKTDTEICTLRRDLQACRTANVTESDNRRTADIALGTKLDDLRVEFATLKTTQVTNDTKLADLLHTDIDHLKHLANTFNALNKEEPLNHYHIATLEARLAEAQSCLATLTARLDTLTSTGSIKPVVVFDPQHRSTQTKHVKDLSGSGNDGTMSEGIHLSTDKLGWIFNRVANGRSGITCKNIQANDMSITAWIKTTDVGHGTNHYEIMHIAAAECCGFANDWGFGVDSTGCLAFGNGSSAGDLTFRTTDAVNTGGWTHVAVTRVMYTGAILLYIDGVQKGSGTGFTTQSSACASMAIGYGQDYPSYSMGGQIGRVMVYDGVLSTMEIELQFRTTHTSYFTGTSVS
jgi:hypothetical protein